MKCSSLDNLAETLSFCILKIGKIENFGDVLHQLSRWALQGIIQHFFSYITLASGPIHAFLEFFNHSSAQYSFQLTGYFPIYPMDCWNKG